jgi:hypothetical protein
MSYSITISGHLVGNEAEATEQSIADKAREFVQSLEGVNAASFNGQHTGTLNLLAQEDADAGS